MTSQEGERELCDDIIKIVTMAVWGQKFVRRQFGQASECIQTVTFQRFDILL